MLNIYNKFDRPEELSGYEVNSRFFTALDKLMRGSINAEDKRLLIQNKDLIKKIPKDAVMYAGYIEHGRWLDAEPYIIKSRNPAYSYALYIIKRRWKDIGYPEVEQLFMNEPITAYHYARYIIKGRWLEAESIIKTDANIWSEYKEDFGIE